MLSLPKLNHRLKMNSPEYASWINKKEIFVDQLTEVNINRLHYTLNILGNPPSLGEPVFPMALLILGEPSVRPDELGEDGHPARGGFMPPVPLKRRMFAGGDYEFFQPLNVGDKVYVSWKITDITRKTGSSGELVFVDILREFKVNQQLYATENGTSSIRTQNRKPVRQMKLKCQENGQRKLKQMQCSCFVTQPLRLTDTVYIMTEHMLLKWKVIRV